MKKAVKWILISLLGIIIINVIILGIVFIRIKDTTDETNPLIIENNISLEDAISKNMTYALEETSDTGKAMISLSEYDLNEILYGLIKSIDFKGGFKIKSGYVKLTNEEYKIYLPTMVFGRPTLLNGNITLSDDGETLHIGIINLAAGDVNLKSGFISSVLSFLGLKRSIIKSFADYGIKAKFKADHLDLSITRDDVKTLLDKMLSKTDIKDFAVSLYNIFFIENKCINLNINNPLDLSICLDFSMFEGAKDLSYDGVKQKVGDLLANKKIKYSDSSIASTYFLTGYQYLSSEQKEETDKVMSGIWDDITYKTNSGMIAREKASMIDIVKAQASVPSFNGLNISDAEINNIFSKFSLLGAGLSFASYENNDVAYIFVSLFEVEISDDFLEIFVGLNINGYVVTLSVGIDVPASKAVSITGYTKYIKLGNVLVGETDTKNVFAFLIDMLTEEEEWIKGDKEAKSITFDFTSLYEDIDVLRILFEKAESINSRLYENTNPPYYCKGYLKIKIGV